MKGAKNTIGGIRAVNEQSTSVLSRLLRPADEFQPKTYYQDYLKLSELKELVDKSEDFSFTEGNDGTIDIKGIANIVHSESGVQLSQSFEYEMLLKLDKIYQVDKQVLDAVLSGNDNSNIAPEKDEMRLSSIKQVKFDRRGSKLRIPNYHQSISFQSGWKQTDFLRVFFGDEIKEFGNLNAQEIWKIVENGAVKMPSDFPRKCRDNQRKINAKVSRITGNPQELILRENQQYSLNRKFGK